MYRAIFLIGIFFLCSSVPALAADEIKERAVAPGVFQQAPQAGISAGAATQPAQPGLSAGVSTRASAADQQLIALQQQVQALQAQVAALQSVLVVTPGGVTLQGQTVTLSSPQGIAIQTQKDLSVTAGMSMTLQSGTNMAVKGGATTTMQGAGGLNLKGPTVRLNNGSTPIATVGSAVAGGKIVTGSPMLLGE